MFKKLFFPFTSFIVIAVVILFSCTEPIIVENKSDNSKEQDLLKSTQNSDEKNGNDLIFVGKIIDYKIIKENGVEKKVPIYDLGTKVNFDEKAMVCDYKKVYIYELHHDAPKSGKVLGVWNTKPQYKTATELHEKWGFSGYMVTSYSAKQTCENIGYNPNYLMAHISVNKNGQYSIPIGTFNQYHLDEAYERGWISNSDVYDISNSIYSSNNYAKLFLSSYQDDVFTKSFYNSILQITPNTKMICDQYYDGTIFYGHDQRPYWDWFKDNYGSSRVISHWMHLIIDAKDDDFDILFGKANNLGLNELWLYAGNANNSWPGYNEALTSSNYTTYLYEFCSDAYFKGWLRKYMAKYCYWYKCPDEYGDPCYCQDNSTGWVLDAIALESIFEV